MEVRKIAFHQFGLMERPPRLGERFDRYEPERYGCVAVADDLIDGVTEAFGGITAFRHTIDRPCSGLEEAGITLIPPKSAYRLAEALGPNEALSSFRDLLIQAERTQKWIIHFGI